MEFMKKITTEFDDLVDNLGRVYLIVLFVSAVIWAFIAVNNFETPTIFKLALIYSLLLIFGFLGVSYDRRAQQLGLDSRIWEGKNLKFKLGLSILIFFLWYLIFMSGGLSIATAQSVTGGATFSVSGSLNFLLTGILGPIAENIFFFGVINITMIYIIRQILESKKNSQGIAMAVFMLISTPLFLSVPNAIFYIGTASGLMLLTVITRNKFLMKFAPIAIAAFYVGGILFPKFHNYAYQLNEKHYVAASIFGIIACVLAGSVGMLPVDILHIGNNVVVVTGLAG